MKVSGMILALLVSTNILASAPKVIYGDDDRLELYNTTDSLHYELANSTAAMISNSSLETSADGETVNISGTPLVERGICSSERFSKQTAAANCSGFLVAPDLIVTAGHCVRSNRGCNRNKWVFDYALFAPGHNPNEVSSSSVYSCKEIVERSMSGSDDYALIRLEKDVEDRRPLTVRKTDKVSLGTELVVIGHPTGLPAKVANGAIVRENDHPVYFASNLDTYGGNSGSAVFDAETGVVEGILVRGETDYVYDRDQRCRVSNNCDDDGCRGEDVTRITNIQALMDL